MIKEYIVIAFTENQIGVLNRITALYLRRKINIESLKVSESSIKGISMFVISAFTTQEVIDKLAKQLRNIVEVIQVEYYSNDELITQEIALYKLSSKIFKESGTVDMIVREWSARNRISVEDYLKYTGVTMDQFRANFTEVAKRQVDLRLALEKIAELENITVSDEDVEKEYADMAEQYKMEADKIKAAVPADAIKNDLKIEKALDLVRDSAKIEEVTE